MLSSSLAAMCFEMQSAQNECEQALLVNISAADFVSVQIMHKEVSEPDDEDDDSPFRITLLEDEDTFSDFTIGVVIEADTEDAIASWSCNDSANFSSEIGKTVSSSRRAEKYISSTKPKPNDASAAIRLEIQFQTAD